MASTTPPRERLVALDVFRGITVAAMLLVNNPGSWNAIYEPLEHAPWHGWTPTDLIFPFFLFIVGITTYLAAAARRERGVDDGQLVRQILLRGALIVLFGILLNAFPFYPLERITGVRFPGVLQRIGVCYICAALLTLRTTVRQQIAIIAALLLGYWAAMTLIPVPGQTVTGRALIDEPSASLAAWIDRGIFGSHLWRSSKTWDPEGLLSTIPAIGTTMLGVLAGRWLGSTQRPLAERLTGLFGVGCLLMVAGLMWHWVFPINKNIWTSSYVLFTAGMAAAALATCSWLIDMLGLRRWTTPFAVFGVNPLLAFIGSGMMARLIYSVIQVPFRGETVSIQRAIYESAFASWLAPRNASLLFAVTFVLLWIGLLWTLYRRRVYLRV
ncbi:MAG TPA: heparan-alpha-glucosaminide N-acetyltransferase domain-containing protein [Gemmatimonadaceae bacterium]|nr:heparan-alpha-glucosaminide N-acetyltransferase domain-containing protein [Gemmatimonadaceae bacterium]